MQLFVSTQPPVKLRASLIEPALRILRIVKRQRLLGQLQRMLRIEHYRELFRARRVLTGHDRPRMRAMRNPARMQRNRAAFDPAARTKISTHIKQYLVRFDVVVHPRDFYGLRVRIEHARRKRAYDVAANLKCLMDRRRLMDRACNRLEVMSVEREWVEKAVPPNRVERMMRHCNVLPARAVFHQNIYIFLLVDCDQFTRRMQIALRIWRAHFDLAFVIQVTLRNPHRPGRLENKIILLFNIVRHDSVSDAARNDNVILGPIRQLAENRFNYTAAVENENDLIGAAVFVILEFVVGLCWLRAVRGHVLVEKHRDASGVEVAAPWNVRRF